MYLKSSNLQIYCVYAINSALTIHLEFTLFVFKLIASQIFFLSLVRDQERQSNPWPYRMSGKHIVFSRGGVSESSNQVIMLFCSYNNKRVYEWSKLSSYPSIFTANMHLASANFTTFDSLGRKTLRSSY